MRKSAIIKKSVISAMLIVLLGCATLHQKAEKHLKNEAYAEAINVYEQILARSPDDSDAKAGLTLARRGWIGQKLIEVRLLRLAGNLDMSLELLRDVYNNEAQWGVFPFSAAAFTQEEETESARQSVVHMVENSISSHTPLKAQYYLERYKTLFQSNQANDQYSLLVTTAKSSGLQQCTSMAKNIGEEQYFYGSFIRKFCRVWGYEDVDLNRPFNNLKDELYSAIEINFSGNGFPNEYRIQLEKKLFSHFKQTPWHHTSGEKILNVGIDGKFIYSHKKQTKKLTHSYTESVPYKVERIEKKPADKKTPVANTTLMNNLRTKFDSNSKTPNTRDNGDGTITVIETRYRKETRFKNYNATEHREIFDFSLNLKGTLSNNRLELSHNSADQKVSIEHYNDMPSIGLHPKPLSITDKYQWLESRTDEFAKTLEISLLENWDEKYCAEQATESKTLDSLEYMFRCLRDQNTTSFQNVNQWFEENMGLNYEKSQSVLNRKLNPT